MPVADVGRYGVHGSRPVQGRDGDEVFELFGLEADHHRLESRGLELEDAFGLPFSQHGKGGGVVFRNGLHGEVRFFSPYEFLAVLDDGQGTEP